MASTHPVFGTTIVNYGTTLARRLNLSYVSAVLLLNLID